MPSGMSNVIQKLFAKFMPVSQKKLCYSIAETSKILGISERNIYKHIKQKKIHAIQIEKGGNFRISNEEIERLKNKR